MYKLTRIQSVQSKTYSYCVDCRYTPNSCQFVHNNLFREHTSKIVWFGELQLLVSTIVGLMVYIPDTFPDFLSVMRKMTEILYEIVQLIRPKGQEFIQNCLSKNISGPGIYTPPKITANQSLLEYNKFTSCTLCFCYNSGRR